MRCISEIDEGDSATPRKYKKGAKVNNNLNQDCVQKVKPANSQLKYSPNVGTGSS